MDTIELSHLLTVERIEDNLFRTVVADEAAAPMYGGQVAAQALRAAAATVAGDRQPHSLHGYFLNGGDASRRVLLTVHLDRDGNSYSNRRVTAVQDGAAIFSMVASFHVPEPGQDYQAHQIPQVAGPDELPDWRMPTRMRGVDMRVPEQPKPDQRRPSRIWLRPRHPLPDDIMHACALTYLSDMCDGLRLVPGNLTSGPLPSIDHSVWIYRKIALDDWVLLDLHPESAHSGRGVYTGQIFARDGTLAAGIAQESVYRPRSPRLVRCDRHTAGPASAGVDPH
jgi:acyl-CoA thioesterase II